MCILSLITNKKQTHSSIEIASDVATDIKYVYYLIAPSDLIQRRKFKPYIFSNWNLWFNQIKYKWNDSNEVNSIELNWLSWCGKWECVSELNHCFPNKLVRNRQIFAATNFDHWYATRLCNIVLYKSILPPIASPLPPSISCMCISFRPLFLLLLCIYNIYIVHFCGPVFWFQSFLFATFSAQIKSQFPVQIKNSLRMELNWLRLIKN